MRICGVDKGENGARPIQQRGNANTDVVESALRGSQTLILRKVSIIRRASETPYGGERARGESAESAGVGGGEVEDREGG